MRRSHLHFYSNHLHLLSFLIFFNPHFSIVCRTVTESMIGYNILIDYIPRVELLSSLDYFDKYFQVYSTNKPCEICIPWPPRSKLTRELSFLRMLRTISQHWQPYLLLMESWSRIFLNLYCQKCSEVHLLFQQISTLRCALYCSAFLSSALHCSHLRCFAVHCWQETILTRGSLFSFHYLFYRILASAFLISKCFPFSNA